MLKAEAGEKLDKGGTLSVWLRHLRTRTAAAILSAALILGLSGFSPENQAFASGHALNDNASGIYIMRSIINGNVWLTHERIPTCPALV
jgi:hypothetical protein